MSHLLLHVVQRVWRVNGEADKDDVRVGVGERAETVIIFLTSGIPKSQLYMLIVDLNICNVVLKDRGDINLYIISTKNRVVIV